MTPISVIIPSLVLFLIYTTKMNEEITKKYPWRQ